VTGRIRVLLVDDDALVRSGLRLMLAGDPGLEVVGELEDGAGLASAVRDLAPDVVLLDVRMPGTDGLAALRTLDPAGSGGKPPAVLILTTLATDSVLLEALRAGAAGFLLKHTPPAEIVAAVRSAAAGDPTVSPGALRQLIQHVTGESAEGRGDREEAERFALLSDRERDVAAAVVDGLSNADIAARLHLSQGTVKTHLSSALTKLGLDNRTQLAIVAQRVGTGR
jgi:DNA-binding NarL/FixJ family response regulator